MPKKITDWSNIYKREDEDSEDERRQERRSTKKSGKVVVRRRGEKVKEDRSPSVSPEPRKRERKSHSSSSARDERKHSSSSTRDEKKRSSSSTKDEKTSSRRREKEPESDEEDQRSRDSSDQRDKRKPAPRRRDSMREAVMKREKVRREDEEYDKYQDELAEKSRSEMANVILYVKRDRRNPKVLDPNSEAACALSRGLENEVYMIIVDDIDPRKKRPPWLDQAPTAWDRIDNRIYKGSAAIDFLTSLAKETPTDFAPVRRGKSSGTYNVGESVTKASGGYSTKKNKLSSDEFTQYMELRERQTRNIGNRVPSYRGKNLPSIRHDAELSDSMKMKGRVHPLHRSIMEQKAQEDRYRMAKLASQRGRR